MEKSGLIDLSDLKPRNYETFFLKRNPFPGIGVPGDTILFTVDREEIQKRFKETIADLQKNETSLITVLIGDYGSGKSHLLKLFKQSVNTYLLSQDPSILSVYIKSPGEDFGEFYSQFIDDIGKSLISAYSQETIKEFLLVTHRSDYLKYLPSEDLKKSITDSAFDIGDLVKKSRYLDLFKDIRSEKFSEIGSNDLVYAFLSLSHPDLSTRSWKWFLMDKIDKKDYKDHLLIESQIDDEKAAYIIFKNFIKLFAILKIQSFVIVVDELEKIGSLSSQKRIDYQEQLRTLFDDHPTNLCLFFAIAPTQWDELIKTSTAFIRRLSGNWNRLEEFRKEDTKELIEKYLEYSRVKNYNSQKVREKFPDCEPSLCPFTKESIDTIQKLSEGRISRILLICRKSLEHFYDHQDKFKSVNSALVEEVLKGG